MENKQENIENDKSVESNSPLNTENPDSLFPPKKKKKRIIISSILGILLLGGLLGGYFFQKEKEKEEYIEEVRAIILTMTVDGSKAEDMVNTYEDVWQSAIYNDSYTINGQYNRLSWGEDFNTALKALRKSYNESGDTEFLENQLTSMNSRVKALRNPPNEYKDIYESIVELYKSYKSFVDLAVSPSGSLQTYRENSVNIKTAFLEKLEETKVRLPEIEEDLEHLEKDSN